MDEVIKKLIYALTRCEKLHLSIPIKSFVRGLWCYIVYYLLIVWKRISKRKKLIKYCRYSLCTISITIFVLSAPIIINFLSKDLFNIPGNFITNAANAQYILSALAQSQAAIIAIVFTAAMIIFQMTIGLESKNITSNPLKYKGVIILIFLYAFSIGYDLILLTLIEDKYTMVNVFAPILILNILIFALFPVIISMVQYMHDKVIADKARTGKNKHLVKLDLRRAFLADAKLSKAKLNYAQLCDAKLPNADLKDAEMINTKLTSVKSTI